MNLSTEGLARTCASHPKRIVFIWLGIVILGVLIAGALCESAITNEGGFMRDMPDSVIAADLLEERLTGPSEGINEFVVVRSASLTVDDPAFRERVESLFAEISTAGEKVVNDAPVLAGAVNYYTTGDESLVSEDRHTTLMLLTLAGELDDVIDTLPPIQEIVEDADRVDGFDTIMVGMASIGTKQNEIAENDLITGEGIGLLAAMVILILVFRALGAAPVPIYLAIVTIIMALAAFSLIGQIQPVSFFIINMITMIGLAVGIDYSLFIVGRFREERAAGVEKVEAIARAGATASRAVFFSGVTVVLALLGMLLVPANIFFSLGLGAILAAVMAVIAAMTLLPAILGLMGDKVNAVRIPFPGAASGSGGGFWNWVTRLVMGHPVAGLLLSVGLLVVLAIPALDLKTGMAGISTFSDKHRFVEGFNMLVEDFSAGMIQTMNIVIDADDVNSAGVQESVDRLQGLLAQDPIFTPTELVVSPAGNLGLLAVPVNADSNDLAFEKVRKVRNDYIPQAGFPDDVNVYVGGNHADGVDFIALGDQWLPRVVIFILVLSFILLTVVFRSLVVPAKAIIMNLLAIGATYGLMTFVFIQGNGADFLGFTQVDAIDSWIPLFLFAVLFGLSMDYHVILLSRIRERFDQTGNNEESVAFGLRSTAGMITGAAIVMVAVFWGFALGEMAMFQQMGFGLAVAVILDATVVRSILVPSSMRLLGARNWYLPGFLQWLPDLRVEPVREQAGATASDGD